MSFHVSIWSKYRKAQIIVGARSVFKSGYKSQRISYSMSFFAVDIRGKG